MTSATNKSASKSPSPKAAPAYTQSELYDSPEDLARWPLLAPLLRTWQTEVWEKDHSEFRGCWHYDQQAMRLQHTHKWAVYLAAFTGTVAVVLAIVQLGIEGRDYFAEFLGYFIGIPLGVAALEAAPNYLMYLEVACLVLAMVTIALSAFFKLDHRWRELRFKAEHYRMLKFRFLHDAARWLAVDEEERGLHLFTHLSQIHAANSKKIREWIHWKTELLPLLEKPQVQPEQALSVEIAVYFGERRIAPQKKYFHDRGHQLHGVERIVRWVGPGLFFASVVFAFVHAAIHVLHGTHEPRANVHLGTQRTGSMIIASKRAKNSHEEQNLLETPGDQHSSNSLLLVIATALALLAAILPVAAAGVRTVRGAFEFGRNSLRFESMAHHLEHLLQELERAQTPEAMLTILRRGEYAMESEHRAWMRLMMEAEWFG